MKQNQQPRREQSEAEGQRAGTRSEPWNINFRVSWHTAPGLPPVGSLARWDDGLAAHRRERSGDTAGTPCLRARPQPLTDEKRLTPTEAAETEETVGSFIPGSSVYRPGRGTPTVPLGIIPELEWPSLPSTSQSTSTLEPQDLGVESGPNIN